LSAIVLYFLLLFQKTPFVPPGAVEGMLRTLEGTPAIAVRVVAYKVQGSGNPDDNLNYFELGRPSNTTQTDNDGHYAMMDLAPGVYWIMAGTAGQGVYYPGTPNLKEATKITVISNEIVEGLDMKLLSRYGGKVSGRVNADMALLGQRSVTVTGPPLEDLVEVPVNPDGSFQLPQLPPGDLLLSMYPPTSGMPSVKIKVTNTDVTGEELTPLPTQTVTGRIVVNKGPIPNGIYLLFETEKTQVGATINADGTFVAQLHAATHQVNVAGLPVGYSLASVHIGSQDVTPGIAVAKKDISDVVVSLNAPQRLAVIRGRITGLEPSRYPATRVELTGLIIGALQANVRQDGTFEFPAVIPGLYTLKLNSVPEFSSMLVSADSADTFDVTVAVPGR
jgi:large repetitive protein